MHEYANILKCDAYFSFVALIPLTIIFLFSLVLFGRPNVDREKIENSDMISENVNLDD